MDKDNRGTSLIELIFVMAILAVLAGSIGLGVGLVSGRPAEQCAKKLETLMQNNRVTAMGKFDSYLKIFYTPTGGVMAVEYIVKPDGTPIKTQTAILANKDVWVEYEVDDNGTYIPIGFATDPLIISFSRSSGAFNDLSAMGSSYMNKYCTEIKISKGSTVKTLELTYTTGKISLN